MIKVKAHAKSIDGKTIKVVLYDTASGRVLSQNDIDAAPTRTAPEGQMSGIQHVEAFLDQYHRSNPDGGMVSYTIENFAEMSAMPGSTPETAGGLVEAYTEEELKTATGSEPKIKTSEDGRPSFEAMTVVVEDRSLKTEEGFTLHDGPPEIQATIGPAEPPEVKIKKAPPPIGQLPQFIAGMDRNTSTPADLDPQALAEEVEDYGSLLGETGLVAGNDFSIPNSFFDDRGEPERITASEAASTEDADSEGNPDTDVDEERDKEAKRPPATPKRKRAVQSKGISKEAEAKISTMSKKEADRNRGIAGDPHALDPCPGFVQARNEKVISHKYNTWIVMGRDRADPEKASRASGYGGRGNTQCGAIDIVVGRMSPNPTSVGEDGKRTEVDPMFNLTQKGDQVQCDAARIYISQKTDVDKNFNLKAGKVGLAEARSAIAMKADGIRIMAREGIKLVTRADKMNSQGGPITKIRGIDIIAGNDEKSLQPMVLGGNMRECIEDMASVLSEVVGTLSHVVSNVAQLDAALSTHFHPSPFFGAPTLPSPTLTPVAIASLVKLASIDTFSAAAQKFNIARVKQLYTGPGAKKPIRSKYNNVN